jgi:glutamine synthetase
MLDPGNAAARKDAVERLQGLAGKGRVEAVDLKFIDLPGRWHHLSLPMDRLDEALLCDGVAFDGSSIPGYANAASSDMTLIPDPDTAFIDPFWERPTLSLICDISKGDGHSCMRDPRGAARRAEAFLRTTGIADTAMMSPEFEFFVFDSVRHRCDVHTASYAVDSEEGEWNSESAASRGTRLPLGGGYHALPPRDRLFGLRAEMVRTIEQCGIPVKYHHHEGGGPGQSEIEVLFFPLLRAGDVTMMVKYIIRMVADRAGRVATFMPKPLWNAAGSGMHVHQHLFSGRRPLFWDEKGWAQLSETALHYIGGLLHHGSALLGLTSPSTNSYKRLVPGFESPVHLIYGLANRGAAVRIPEGGRTPETKRIEFRPPDATCNIYLALAGMLMAGIDGIRRRIDPREAGFGPHDEDLSVRPEAIGREPGTVPLSLAGAMDALEKDHAFLLEGGVFDEETLAVWIEMKRRESWDVSKRPHPREIALYFDA